MQELEEMYFELRKNNKELYDKYFELKKEHNDLEMKYRIVCEKLDAHQKCLRDFNIYSVRKLRKVLENSRTW